MADDPLFKFLQSVTEKIKVEKEHKALMKKIDDNIVVEPAEDPLLSAINVLKQKIVEVKQPAILEVIADNAVITTEVALETIEEKDNFGDFLSKLKDIISSDKPKNTTPIVSVETTAPVVQELENAEPEIEDSKPGVQDIKNNYVDVLDKLSNEVAVEKEPQKISEIKKLIEQYAEKYFKKAAVMSEYAGGGGTNAVQYANGGVMNGDLNINGHILSGGRDISNYFGTGGGGLTDRLINGSYQVVLSSNGTLIFPGSGTLTDTASVAQVGFEINGLFNYAGQTSVGLNTFNAGLGNPAWGPAIQANPTDYEIVFNGGLVATIASAAGTASPGARWDFTGSWPANPTGAPVTIRAKNYTPGVQGTDGIRLASNNNSWTFGTDGKLTVPGAIGTTTGNSKLDLVGLGPNTVYLTTTTDDTTTLFMGVDPVELRANNYVSITTNTGDVSRLWTFGADGSLTFPDNTTQTTAFTGNPDLTPYAKVTDFVHLSGDTMTGALSAPALSADIIKATGGDSTQWNTAYQNVSSQSLNSTDVVAFDGVSVNALNITGAVNAEGANFNFCTFNTDIAIAEIGSFYKGTFQALPDSLTTNRTYNLPDDTGTLLLSSPYIVYNNQDTTFGQNVTINGNLTALGSSTFRNTIFTTTSALSVVNNGPGPALYVSQSPGNFDVASFYDQDGIEVLHIGNAPTPGTLAKVGINESYPGAELTVNGTISSNGTITAEDGNSNDWNSNYTTTNANSAFWTNAYTNLVTNSAAYLLSGTDVNLGQIPVLSANWNNTYNAFSANSGKYENSYTNLVTNSATYLGTTRQFDIVAVEPNSYNYLGYAVPGSTTSQSVWTIKRLYFSTAGTLLSSATITNAIWNNRYSYTY